MLDENTLLKEVFAISANTAKSHNLSFYFNDWQLHLEFDKENIERTGCENEEISRKITNYVVK